MHILFVAGEATPFIKTGGLADVIGSLPRALHKLGINVSVIMPKYKAIDLHYTSKMDTLHVDQVKVDWRDQYCGLMYKKHNNIDFYFIDNEFYFHRDNLYGEYDDGERFSFFDRAVLDMIPHLKGGKPDVIHCHDWHTGAIPALYKTEYAAKEGYENIKLIYTIHNLKYQGVFPMSVGTELLGLPEEALGVEGMEFYGNVNFMKGGIIFSDHVTTVSTTYADEIQTPYYGEQLDGLLTAKKDHLSGIVNGIDYKTWNPEDDDALIMPFKGTQPMRKRKIKEDLQKMLRLEVNGDIPMIAMVTRIVEQKGFDLVCHVLQEILSLPLQLVILGVGDEKYEGMLMYYAQQHPEKFAVELFFDEVLSHRIYGASDMFLIPSKFEPCGIGQLIAMRYGSIPIGRRTGGLADTITQANLKEGTGTGFLFNNFNAHEMLYEIESAVDLYHENPKIWKRLIKNAMKEDFSWQNSANAYKDLYETVLND